LAAEHPPRLILKIDIGELLTGTIRHDEGRTNILGSPRRREAAGHQSRSNSQKINKTITTMTPRVSKAFMAPRASKLYRRREAANASVSIFVFVRECFTCGRVDEMLSAAREATH
jgi:hypothetical protein